MEMATGSVCILSVSLIIASLTDPKLPIHLKSFAAVLKWAEFIWILTCHLMPDLKGIEIES